MDSAASGNRSKNSFNLRLDYRFIIGLLLLIIIAMLLLWRPWEPRFDAEARTVTVTGDAKILAEPDEYVFTPIYEFQNADRAAALAEMSTRSDEIIAELEKIGVAGSAIKSNSEGYDYPMFEKQGVAVPTYSLRLTVTITDKALAQKVQDYLASTTPTGAVSPQLDFSPAKRKQLESQARNDATKDARTKAEQSARNLGFSVGKVKSVNDAGTFGEIYPILREGIADDHAATTSLGLQPGQNELNYQVNVVYFVQ